MAEWVGVWVGGRMKEGLKGWMNKAVIECYLMDKMHRRAPLNERIKEWTHSIATQSDHH